MRLALRKQQARAGDITLLFADESEALTHPCLARAWAKRGADLRVPAPGQSRKIAMLGALDFITRTLVMETSHTRKSADFIALLRRLDHLFGPRPGVETKPVVLVLDNGPIHKSRASLAALAERAHWLIVEWLPKYAPELNDIERSWASLKTNHLAHQTFASQDALETAIHRAREALNQRSKVIALANQRIHA